MPDDHVLVIMSIVGHGRTHLVMSLSIDGKGDADGTAGKGHAWHETQQQDGDNGEPKEHCSFVQHEVFPFSANH